MGSGIRIYYYDRIKRGVIFEKTREIVGGFYVGCEHYYSGLDISIELFNILCSVDFPENCGCLIRKLLAEERMKLVR
jgi:hypothetical protein